MKNKKETLIKVTDLHKKFSVGEDVGVEVLKGIDMEVFSGDFVIILGPSGCGKSTLLHTVLGLEKPSLGNILFQGKEVYALGDDERSELRKRYVGTIFQQPIWVKSLNVLGNVALPLNLVGEEEMMALSKALEKLKLVGMEDWAYYMPTELSAGQQQKVSLARALLIDPILVVADEPTGNLDTVSGCELMDALLDVNQKGKTIVMITHDLEYVRYANKVFHMIDGKIVNSMEQVQRRLKKGPCTNGKKEGNLFSESNVRNPNFLKSLKT